MFGALRNRAHFAAAMLAGALLLGSCGGAADDGDDAESAPPPVVIDSVEAAIEHGLLIFIEPEEAGAISEVVAAEARDLYTTVGVRASIGFSNVARLSFERSEGRLILHAETGDFVREGDLLATLSFEDEEFIINRRFAEIRLEQAEREFAQNILDREVEIANARQAMNEAPPGEWEELYVRLQQLELEFEVFRRAAVRSRDDVRESLREINEIIAGDNIYSPFDGYVTRTERDGLFIRDFRTVVTVVDDSDFFFLMRADALNNLPDHVPRQLLFRVGNVITVGTDLVVAGRDGEDDRTERLEFDVEVVTVPGDSGAMPIAMPVDPDGLREMLAELNRDRGLFQMEQWNLLGETDIHWGTGSIVVPRDALRNPGSPFPYVFQIVDGNMVRRFVDVGLVRPDFAQILSGLDAGSQVVVFR